MSINENALGQEGAKKLLSSIKSTANYTISTIESQFRQAMRDAGINYSGEIIANKKINRGHIEGDKRGSKNLAYILHVDGYAAGWFKDHKSGISQTWRSSSGSCVPYTSIKQREESKLQHEAEIIQKNAEAARKASHIWNQSKLITRQSDHAYLEKKRIQPNGARLSRGALVIPIYNESNQLVNLQFINNQDDKRFLTGGRKSGCFYIIGDFSRCILICEGFATGASLFQESRQRVVIAFDAGNLLPVAKNIRKLSPDAEIIICGDNDRSGIGQAKAREAALAIGGKILIPPILGFDWNDTLLEGDYQNG